MAKKKQIKVSKDNALTFVGKKLNINSLVSTAVEDILYQMYISNADVQRAIADKNNLIFESGFYFENGKKEKVENSETDKIKKILNKHKKFDEFKKEFNYYRNIFGNVYTHLITNVDNDLIGIQTLDPRFIKEDYDKEGNFIGYLYDGQYKISKNKIIHFKHGFDPNNKLKGLSPLVGGIIDILGDNEAAKSNFMFFLNNAIPAFLLKFADGTDDDEIITYMNAMKEQFAGGNNQHKIGGMKGVEGIERLQKEFKDMEYKIMRDFTTEKVATCLGVPLTRLNKVNVTYNNMKEAFEQYIEATIINEEKDFCNYLNDIISYQYNTDELKITFKNDHIDNSSYLTDLFIKQIENGIITPAKAASSLGYDIVDKENQDKIYLKTSLINIEDVGMNIIPATNTNEI